MSLSISNSKFTDAINHDLERNNIKVCDENSVSNKLFRKKSVQFCGNENIKQDSIMNDVQVINRRTSLINSDDNSYCNTGGYITNRRTSLRKVSLSIQEGKVFDINTLPNNLKQEFFDEQNELALRDMSAELVNYILKNAVKIAIHEIKANV